MNTKRMAILGATLFTISLLSACNRQPESTQATFLPAAADNSRNRTAPANAAAPSSSANSYADVVDRVAPAVVTVRSSRRVRAPEAFSFDDDLLGRLFGSRAPQARRAPPQVQRGLGSGVIVRADGYILTNHHVVDGAEDIKVDLIDRRTISAKLVGSDPPSDLALLKVDGGNLPVLNLGDSDKVRVGDVCLAVGNPLGLGQTVTAGIISAKSRSTGLSNGSFEDFLQTDAPINQGNSGGALVNTAGQLIGINSQILSPTGGNIGIGFAIPSNMAKNVMEQLANTGKVRRGLLGVGIQPVTSDVAASLGLKDVKGVLVNSVTSGGPAEKAGLRRGDVITAFNGSRIEDSNSFRNLVASTAPGTAATITYLRDGKEGQAKVTLGEFTPEARNAERGGAPGGSTDSGGKLGIGVQPLTPELAEELGLRKGTQGLVVGEVDPSGPAAAGGVQPGDVIVEANRQPVRTIEDLRRAIDAAAARPLLVLINRGGQTVYITLRP